MNDRTDANRVDHHSGSRGDRAGDTRLYLEKATPMDITSIMLDHLRAQRAQLDRLITWLEEMREWNMKNSAFVTNPMINAAAPGAMTERITIGAGPEPPPLAAHGETGNNDG